MPYVSSTPTASGNTFYIAANIIFDIATGETKNVLMLVNKSEDASIFNQKDAQNYANFVKARAPKIIWSIEHVTPMTPGLFPQVMSMPTDRFIIKGVQYV